MAMAPGALIWLWCPYNFKAFFSMLVMYVGSGLRSFGALASSHHAHHFDATEIVFDWQNMAIQFLIKYCFGRTLLDDRQLPNPS